MKNLSLFDREFLAKIHVDAKPRRFTDDLFLRACGVEALGGGKSSDGISRLLRIYVLDGTWPQDVADEREAELREEALYGRRFARFMKGCQETNIENLLAAYEQQVAHEAEIQAVPSASPSIQRPAFPKTGRCAGCGRLVFQSLQRIGCVFNSWGIPHSLHSTVNWTCLIGSGVHTSPPKKLNLSAVSITKTTKTKRINAKTIKVRPTVLERLRQRRRHSLGQRNDNRTTWRGDAPNRAGHDA